MRRKGLTKILFICITILFLCGTVGMASAFSNSGGENWKYYKEITIKENSGETLTDFQVLVELNSANFNFSKAKPADSDMRFSANGEELSYWIEEWDAVGKKARIWVKVPLILANGETKIKMYYGNPGAGAVSDGSNTFIEFMEIKRYEFPVSYESPCKSFLHKVEVPETYIIETLEKAKYGYHLIGFDKLSLDNRIFDISWHTYENEEKYRWIYANGTKLEESSTSRVLPDEYYRIKIVVDENHKKVDCFIYDYNSDSLAAFFKNKDYSHNNPQHLYYIAFVGKESELGRFKKTFSDTMALGVSVSALTVSGGDIYTKYIFIRKYASSEPIITIPTGEEKKTPGFEAVFAIAGLLVLTYLLRKRK